MTKVLLLVGDFVEDYEVRELCCRQNSAALRATQVSQPTHPKSCHFPPSAFLPPAMSHPGHGSISDTAGRADMAAKQIAASFHAVMPCRPDVSFAPPHPPNYSWARRWVSRRMPCVPTRSLGTKLLLQCMTLRQVTGKGGGGTHSLCSCTCIHGAVSWLPAGSTHCCTFWPAGTPDLQRETWPQLYAEL